MIAIKGMKMPKKCYWCTLLDGEYGTCNIIGETKVDMTEERAKNCPLVEIQEPKTGHWIIIDDCEFFIAECSECGKRVDSRMINKYPYCDCGAKMQNTSIKETGQEEKLGKWLEVDTYMYSCSKCNNCFTIVPEDNNISQFNFCPNCGAKMVESEDKE